jgi:hypothetical protein
MLVMNGFNNLRYRDLLFGVSSIAYNSGWGMYGDGGIRVYGDRGIAWQIPPGASGDTLIMGVQAYIWSVTVSNAYDLFGFGSSINIVSDQIVGCDRPCVRVGNDGTVYAYTVGQGGTAALAGTSTKKINKDTWYCMELKVKFHASTGTIDVYVNGESYISATGLNTGAELPVLYEVGGIANLGDNVYFDDIYIMDNSGSFANAPLGSWRIRRVLPTADTTQKDLTPLTGTSNYAMVDDPATGWDGATSYVYTTATGADVYDNATLTLKKIGAAQVVAAAWTGMSNDIIPLAVLGTTTSTTTDRCQLDCVEHFHVMSFNPDTNAAFTQSDIDAIKTGVKIP